MRALAYHPLRVRVAYAEMATAGIYCDLAACPSGHRGQIIHNTDEASWCVLAESLDDLLARYPELPPASWLLLREPNPHGCELVRFIVVAVSNLAVRVGAPTHQRGGVGDGARGPLPSGHVARLRNPLDQARSVELQDIRVVDAQLPLRVATPAHDRSVIEGGAAVGDARCDGGGPRKVAIDARHRDWSELTGARGRVPQLPGPELRQEFEDAVFNEGQPLVELRKRFDPHFFPKPKGADDLDRIKKANATARKLIELLAEIDDLPEAQVRKLEAELGKLRTRLDELAEPLQERVKKATARANKKALEARAKFAESLLDGDEDGEDYDGEDGEDEEMAEVTEIADAVEAKAARAKAPRKRKAK